jgi:hypothetical protein
MYDLRATREWLARTTQCLDAPSLPASGWKTRRSSVRYSMSDERPGVVARVFEISTTLTQFCCKFDDHCAPLPAVAPELAVPATLGRVVVVVPVDAVPVDVLPVTLVPPVVPVDVVPLEPIEPVEPEPDVVPVLDVLPLPDMPALELGAALQTMLTRSPEVTLFKRAAALLDTDRTTGAGAPGDELPGVAGCRTVTVMPDGSTATISAVTR